MADKVPFCFHTH